MKEWYFNENVKGGSSYLIPCSFFLILILVSKVFEMFRFFFFSINYLCFYWFKVCVYLTFRNRLVPLEDIHNLRKHFSLVFIPVFYVITFYILFIEKCSTKIYIYKFLYKRINFLYRGIYQALPNGMCHCL